ncbi:TPA: conjugal transfer protein TraG, partial [Escherichia coli]|nr:conjugal transfer protein TraG [Escherichia coli]
AERERLVQAFVEERIKPQLLQQFEQNKGRTGDGIGNVSAPTVASDLKGEYREQQADMENSAAQHGVKAEGVVATDVQNQRSNVESQVNDEKNTVISSGESSGKEYRDLQNEHDQGKKAFDDAQKAENERQKFYKNDFVISHDENIKQIKNDMSNRFNGKT